MKEISTNHLAIVAMGDLRKDDGTDNGYNGAPFAPAPNLPSTLGDLGPGTTNGEGLMPGVLRLITQVVAELIPVTPTVKTVANLRS